MISVKAGILFLCILFVHCDRLRQLESKMFAMQKMTYQDIGLLRESADRNFEELQRLSMIINASLSQISHPHTPVQTSAVDSKEDESDSKVEYLESQVRRLKRGFKDQKLFFHSWKEDFGSNMKDILEHVIKFQDTLDFISHNVTAIKDRELLNTHKLDALSTVNRNFSEEFISSLELIRTDQKMYTSGKDVLNTCSAAVQNSEQIINLLNASGDFNTIRLVGGSASSGRLEVFMKGAWGTVCDDFFDGNEATVACKTLGFKHGYLGLSGSYGEGSGSVLFDDVQCNGYERTLFHCKINYTPNCGHSEDVNLHCYN